MSVIEASCLGKPIISSDIYGLKDTVINKKTGLMFETGNIEQLNALLLYAINNKIEMKKMGENGKDYVKKTFQKKSFKRMGKVLFRKCVLKN